MALGYAGAGMPLERTVVTTDTIEMIDPFGRAITYLRVSVTDRCDLRCVYCMAEDMTFLPKADVLSLEELERLCAAFIRQGVVKLRITGGEPLVRRGVMTLFQRLGERLGNGLEELTLTTNGTQLARYAEGLVAAGGAPGQCQHGHAGPGAVHADHAMGQAGSGAGGDRGGEGCRAAREDQCGGAAWGERGRDRRTCWPGAASGGTISV